MVLDEVLCERAEELHGWRLSFGGRLITPNDRVVTQEAWMPSREKPIALLVRSDNIVQDNQAPKSYGFFDLTQQGVVYQEVAQVHPGIHQREAYHGDLVLAVILHLRQLPPGIKPTVQLPEMLKKGVDSKHFEYLQANLKPHQTDSEGRRECSRRCKHPYHKVENYQAMPIIDFDTRDLSGRIRSCAISVE